MNIGASSEIDYRKFHIRNYYFDEWLHLRTKTNCRPENISGGDNYKEKQFAAPPIILAATMQGRGRWAAGAANM